jgi:hypothetical protein
VELNSPLPYEVCKEDNGSYSFVTSLGIKYLIYFFDYSDIYPSFKDIFMFNIEPEDSTPHPIDNRISATVIHILDDFFTKKQYALIIICDNLDGKEVKRNKLFQRWFKKYRRNNILKIDLSSKTEDYDTYASLFILSDNPNKEKIIEDFKGLIQHGGIPDS